MLSRALLGAACLAALLIPGFSYADPAPNVRESVAVCDPKAPANCIKPNADGSISTGGAGASAVTIADGASVTLGAKADSYQTDATQTGTLIQFMKGAVYQLGQPSVIASVTHTQTSALAASLAVSAARVLNSFDVVADSTLYAAPWWLLVFDAAALPSNGAVTPAKCYPASAGQLSISGTFGSSAPYFASGVVLGVSTTGCRTLTASTHADLIAFDYR